MSATGKLALAALGALGLNSGAVGAGEIEFYQPTSNDHRIDICLEWGMKCNGEAANAWCTAKGFDRASSWQVAADIGAATPTLVMAANKLCSESYCDGYGAITCALEDAWTQSTGQAGLIVQVERTDHAPLQGLLVIAVPESDVSQTTAALVNAGGLALLHVPPGAYRLIPVNYHNQVQINPQPGFGMNYPAMKNGGFITLTLD